MLSSQAFKPILPITLPTRLNATLPTLIPPYPHLTTYFTTFCLITSLEIQCIIQKSHIIPPKHLFTPSLPPLYHLIFLTTSCQTTYLVQCIIQKNMAYPQKQAKSDKKRQCIPQNSAKTTKIRPKQHIMYGEKTPLTTSVPPLCHLVSPSYHLFSKHIPSDPMYNTKKHIIPPKQSKNSQNQTKIDSRHPKTAQKQPKSDKKQHNIA